MKVPGWIPREETDPVTFRGWIPLAETDPVTFPGRTPSAETDLAQFLGWIPPEEMDQVPGWIPPEEMDPALLLERTPREEMDPVKFPGRTPPAEMNPVTFPGRTPPAEMNPVTFPGRTPPAEMNPVTFPARNPWARTGRGPVKPRREPAQRGLMPEETPQRKTARSAPQSLSKAPFGRFSALSWWVENDLRWWSGKRAGFGSTQERKEGWAEALTGQMAEKSQTPRRRWLRRWTLPAEGETPGWGAAGSGPANGGPSRVQKPLVWTLQPWTQWFPVSP